MLRTFAIVVFASFSILAFAESSAPLGEIDLSTPDATSVVLPIWLAAAADDCSHVTAESGDAGDKCKSDLDCNPGLHCTDAANAKPCTCQHLAIEEPHEDGPGDRIGPNPDPIGPGPGF